MPKPQRAQQRSLKCSVDPQVNERIERKRVQNRISQRCAREKKAAQNLRMEVFRNMVKKSATATAHETNTADVNAYIELMEENERLSEALLRIRKKLLSISNSTATIAEDPIFESLLNCRQTNKPLSPNYTQAQPPLGSIRLHNAEGCNQLSNPVSPTMPRAEAGDMTLLDCPIPCDEEASMWSLLNLDSEPEFGFPGNVVSFSGSRDEPLALLSAIESGSSDQLFDREGRISPRCLTDYVEIACVVYICEELHLPIEASQITGPASLKGLKDQYKDWVSSELINRIARVAVCVMTSCSGLDEYVYSTDTQALMESVMRWRFAPTPEYLVAVQEPFRPTAIQQDCTHSSVIDLVNWPELRSYLLTMDSRIELDSAIRDTVLHTVIDLPQLGVSLSVFDLYYNAIGRTSGTPAISQQELREKMEGRGSKYSADDHAIFCRLWLDILHRMASADEDVTTDFSNVNQQRREILVRNLEVNRWPDWRLSRQYTSMYPLFQYQEGHVASLPMVSASTLWGG